MEVDETAKLKKLPLQLQTSDGKLKSRLFFLTGYKYHPKRAKRLEEAIKKNGGIVASFQTENYDPPISFVICPRGYKNLTFDYCYFEDLVYAWIGKGYVGSGEDSFRCPKIPLKESPRSCEKGNERSQPKSSDQTKKTVPPKIDETNSKVPTSPSLSNIPEERTSPDLVRPRKALLIRQRERRNDNQRDEPSASKAQKEASTEVPQSHGGKRINDEAISSIYPRRPKITPKARPDEPTAPQQSKSGPRQKMQVNVNSNTPQNEPGAYVRKKHSIHTWEIERLLKYMIHHNLLEYINNDRKYDGILSGMKKTELYHVETEAPSSFLTRMRRNVMDELMFSDGSKYNLSPEELEMIRDNIRKHCKKYEDITE